MGRGTIAAMRTLILVLAALCGGCAGMGSVKSVPLSSGPMQTFHAPYSKVIQAANESMPELGLQIRDDEDLDKSTHMLIGESSVSAWSWGELARVVLREIAPGVVEARVVTKWKLATNMSAKWDFAPELFTKMDQKLQR